MDKAEIAKDVGYKFECKKDGLSQLQNGSIKLTLTVNPDDMDINLYSDSMGQRYIAVLVPIDDNEEPVDKPSKKKEISLAQKIHILCSEDSFIEFINCKSITKVTNKQEAEKELKFILSIDSFNEVEQNNDILNRYKEIYSQYESYIQYNKWR